MSEDRTNRAYSERNYAVILAAKLAIEAGYKAGWGIDGNDSWDGDWRVVVYIENPDSGIQASWHMQPSEAELAKRELPKFDGQWDGTFRSRSAEVLETAFDYDGMAVSAQEANVAEFNPNKMPSDDEILLIALDAVESPDEQVVTERCDVHWLPVKYQLFVDRWVEGDDEYFEYYLKLINGFVVANFWKNSYVHDDCSWQVKVGAADIEPYDKDADVQRMTEWCINQFEFGF